MKKVLDLNWSNRILKIIVKRDRSKVSFHTDKAIVIDEMLHHGILNDHIIVRLFESTFLVIHCNLRSVAVKRGEVWKVSLQSTSQKRPFVK